jgi:signal transduction histidine kinase
MPRIPAPDRNEAEPPRRRGRRSSWPADLGGDQILGVLSHELRTPVTTIYGGAQLLATRDLPDERRRALAADVGREAEHLYRIVEDIVILLKAEHGDLHPVGEPVAVGHLVVAAIERELLRDPRLRIRYLGSKDATVDGVDEDLVVHLVRNLLANAIADSASGSPIEIVVDAADDEVAVRFLDSGSPRIEKRPPQPRRRRARPALAGEGDVAMFAASRLVEAMRGRSWVRSRLGGGAEVGFALPISPPAPIRRSA